MKRDVIIFEDKITHENLRWDCYEFLEIENEFKFIAKDKQVNLEDVNQKRHIRKIHKIIHRGAVVEIVIKNEMLNDLFKNLNSQNQKFKNKLNKYEEVKTELYKIKNNPIVKMLFKLKILK